jgi:hypothetical protein
MSLPGKFSRERTMVGWRHALLVAGAVIALVVLFVSAREERPNSEMEFLGAVPTTTSRRRTPSVEVRTVPCAVSFPETHYEATAETRALAQRLVVTQEPVVRDGEEEEGERGMEAAEAGEAEIESTSATPKNSTLPISFESLNESQNLSATPPDPHGAVGPDRVMSVMNSPGTRKTVRSRAPSSCATSSSPPSTPRSSPIRG